MDVVKVALKSPVQDSSPPNDHDLELISGHSSMIALNDDLNEPENLTELEKMSQIDGAAVNPEDPSDISLKSRTPSSLNSNSLNELKRNMETKNVNEVTEDVTMNLTETTKTSNNQNRNAFDYAKAVTSSLKEIGTALPCMCRSKSPLKAIKIPIAEATSYRSVIEKLLPYGQVESVALDPHLRQHTVIFECGCQATKAVNSTMSTIGPFTPPPNFVSQYNPKRFNRQLTNSQEPSRTPQPLFPQFFRIKAKGNPSTVDITASLTKEIGEIPPNCITRVRNSFNLRIEKDAQSLMLTLIDFTKSDVIQEVNPHPELNSSKAVCHSRELYQTKIETIKLHSYPHVKEVHQIKSSHNITIMTFSTPQPPDKIELFGMIFNLEKYREKPKQCNKCFSYMHPSNDCKRNPRCSKCSGFKSNHTEEFCNQSPFCCLCKGDHPPTSRSCQVYSYEEDLLNEALRRGCGRGHIRAERRRTTDKQIQTNNRAETNKVIPPTREEEKDRMYQSQQSTWIEHKNKVRGRNRGKNKPAAIQTSDNITFELPEMYQRKNECRQPDDNQLEQEETMTSDHQNNVETPTNSDSMVLSLEENPDEAPESVNRPIDITETIQASNPQLDTETLLSGELAYEAGEESQEIALKDTSSQKKVSCSPMYENPSLSSSQTRLEPVIPTENPHETTSKQITKKSQTGTRKKVIQTRSLSNSPPLTNLQEPPSKKGKTGLSNLKDNQENTPKNLNSKKQRRCLQCSITYKSPRCLKEHQLFFHPKKDDIPRVEAVPNHDSVRFAREHMCAELTHEQCKILYEIRKNNSPSKGRGSLVDSRGAIYSSISEFRRKKPYGYIKKANQEKIYGPISNEPTKCTDSQKESSKRKRQLEDVTNNIKATNANNSNQKTRTPRYGQLKTSLDPSSSLQIMEIGERPYETESFVREAVARLESATRQTTDSTLLDRTWPGQQNLAIETQNVIQRDPRLRRGSLTNLDELKSLMHQTQTPPKMTEDKQEKQKPQDNSDFQLLTRSVSIDSLSNCYSYPIKPIISFRY